MRQFNTAAFQGAGYNSDGLESGAGYLRTCARSKLDLSLSRLIPLGHGRTISLRADIFNVFNQAAITAVNTQMQLASPADPVTITNLPYDASGNLVVNRSLPKNAGFGGATAYDVPRSIKVQVRFTF